MSCGGTTDKNSFTRSATEELCENMEMYREEYKMEENKVEENKIEDKTEKTFKELYLAGEYRL